MPLLDPAAHPFTEIGMLAIAVCRTGDNQRHVGLIYHLDDREIMLCDLAWHYLLRFEPPELQPWWARSHLFWQSVSLPEVSKKLLAAALEELRVYGNVIPYGFDVVSLCFTPDGEYIPQIPGKGLTCVTFIVEIYKSLSIALLTEDTWPSRPDDVRWQKWIIEKLRETGASSNHVEAMQNDIGICRIRPEEVASAAIKDARPVSFEDCRAEAEEITQLCA